MAATQKVATVFGGTGFIGRQVINLLAAEGISVKVPSRAPEKAYFLRPCGTVGQVVPILCDIYDQNAVDNVIKGSDYVVNCVGILYEKGRSTFKSLHTDLPERIAQSCSVNGVKRLVHISSLGAGKSSSKYAKSKAEGEAKIRANFPGASILKPSVVFGQDDNFFNMFAKLSSIMPMLPLIGGGKTKFQPVYVGDVAKAVMACLTLPSTGIQNPCGNTYELGGPEVIDFKDIYERIFEHTRRRKSLVTIPWGLAKIQGRIMGMLPKPLLTADQIESLKTDSIVADDALTLQNLNIQPTGMGLILPQYLGQYIAGGRFQMHQEHA